MTRRRCSRCSRQRMPRSTASTRAAEAGARPHRVEEPQERGEEPEGAVPQGGAIEAICKSPAVAGMLGVFDCSGVSDGAAAAILCRAEDAHKYSKHPIFIKALSFAAGPAHGYYSQDYDFTTFPRSLPVRRTPTTRPG